jgi:hypothetical protein
MKKYILPILLLALLLLAACSPTVDMNNSNDDGNVGDDTNNNADHTDNDMNNVNTDADDVIVDVPVITLDLSLFPAGDFIGAEYAGLLFSSSEVGQEGAWIVDSEGTARQLIDHGDGFAYNPDTYQLAYTAPEYEEDIHIFNIVTGETVIFETPDILEGNLAFVTGTTFLAFNYMTQENLGPWSGYLGAFDLSTGNFMNYDDQSASYHGFAVSPVFDTIVYDDAGQPMLYSQYSGPEMINMQGLETEFSSFASPAISPDGSTIAFTAYGETAGDGAGIQNGIVIINTTEGTSKVLHLYESFGMRVGPEVVWSPDGSWIAVVTQGEMNAVENGVGLWIINPFSAEPDEHLIGMGNDLLWSSSGATLLYTDWGTGSYLEAKVMQVLTSDFNTVQVPLPAGSFPFQWIDLDN